MAAPTITSIFTGSVALEEESTVLQDYLIGQRLGEGAYGSVYAVTHAPSGKTFALKILQKEDLFVSPAHGPYSADSYTSPTTAAFVDTLEKLIVLEATVMQALEHCHVVKFYRFLNSKSAFYFVMELAEGGELFDLILSKNHFSEPEARLYFQQLISAIDYCHRNGVAHKDLKTENLLLGSDNRLLVCDFGFSSKIPKGSSDDLDDTVVEVGDGADDSGAVFGTLHYMSPEAVVASTVNRLYDGDLSTGVCGGSSFFPGSMDATTMSPCGVDDPSHSGLGVASLITIDDADVVDEDEDEEATSWRQSSTGSAADRRARRSGTPPLARYSTAPALANADSNHYVSGGGSSLMPSRNSCQNLFSISEQEKRSAAKRGLMRESRSMSGLDTLLQNRSHSDGKTAAKAGGGGIKGGLNALVRSFIGPSTSASSSTNGRGAKRSSASPVGARATPPQDHVLVPSLVAKDRSLGGKKTQQKSDKKAKGKKETPISHADETTWDGSATTTGAPRKKHQPTIVDSFMQDLWSAGVILFFMLTGRLPFDGRDDEETLYLIQHHSYEFTEDEVATISTPARDLVHRMLSLDPTDRPTVEQIIETPWFVKDIRLSDDFPHRPDLQEKLTAAGLLEEAFLSFLDFSTTHPVTEKEEQVIKTAFHKIDSDGYGTITRDQIRDMLTTLHGDAVPREEVSELVLLFTGNPQSTEITFTQFREAWVSKDLAHIPFSHNSEFQLANIIGTQMDETERQVVRQLRAAFDSVDDDHTGVIGLHQLRKVFEKMHLEVQDEDILSLISYFHEHDMTVRDTSVTSTASGSPIYALESFSLPATSISTTNRCHYGVSFDSFVSGIVQHDILLRHPLGRRLAAATNLAALFHSCNVKECVRNGFLVVGLQNVVLSKMASIPERLLLLYSDEVVSNTENIYSFRYLGSTALLKGERMTTISPMLVATSLAVVSASVGGASASTQGPAAVLGMSAMERSKSVSGFSYLYNRRGNVASAAAAVAVSIKSSPSWHLREDGAAGRADHITNGCSSRPALTRSNAGSLQHNPVSFIGNLIPQKSHTTQSNTTTTAKKLSKRHGNSTVKQTSPLSSQLPAAVKTTAINSKLTSAAPIITSGCRRAKSGAAGCHEACSPERITRPLQTPHEKFPTSSTGSVGSEDGQSQYSSSRCSNSIVATNECTPASAVLMPTQQPSTSTHRHRGRVGGARSRSSSAAASKSTLPLPPPDRSPVTGSSGRSTPIAPPPPRTTTTTAVALPTRRTLSKKTNATESPEASRMATQAAALNPDHVQPQLSSPGMVGGKGASPKPATKVADQGALVSTIEPEAKATDTAAVCRSNAALAHRSLAFGGSGVVGQVSGVCDVDVILAPACLGYTLVKFRRIHGKTSDFHEAVTYISNLLDGERQQAIEDTMTRGESELM